MVSQHFVLFSSLVLVKINLVGIYRLLKESRHNFRNVLPCRAYPAELVLPACPSGKCAAPAGCGIPAEGQSEPRHRWLQSTWRAGLFLIGQLGCDQSMIVLLFVETYRIRVKA